MTSKEDEWRKSVFEKWQKEENEKTEENFRLFVSNEERKLVKISQDMWI